MAEQPYIDQLLDRIQAYADREAFVWRGKPVTYGEFDSIIAQWTERLKSEGIGQGDCVGVLADYSPQSVGLAFALMRARAIFVPFSEAVEAEMGPLMELGGVQYLFRFDRNDAWSLEVPGDWPTPELIREFRSREVSGLVVFTSGSTGKPKGILHDCNQLAKKFSEARKGYRTLVFLLFDHFGGFNTMLSVISFGGTIIVPDARTPQHVAKIVSETKVELLPVTPTLLNLMLISGTGTQYDLSSVKLITYGTEVMPEATLKRIAVLAPDAKLQQTYGLSELGVLRSKSENSDSLWVKVGGAGFETRIVDDILYVRSESAMIGYLNAPSPFDEDGWMCTGDRVEQRGEYLRILGRESEEINVGGQKVFPAEVETALLEAGNVDDATVYGEAHKLMGAVVMARVKLHEPEDPAELRARLRKHCLTRLAPYKVPVRFQITDDEQHNKRFKKQRPSAPAVPPEA
jgi:acyl-CoA synthetase (AMP-forming)/AMP-acid ligase II